MSQQANVRSIDALRRFRAALIQYAEALQDALDTLQLESQRSVDWIRLDRLAYWPTEARRAADTLNEALEILQLKQLTLDNRDRPAATEERQQVQAAKRRVGLTEDKLRQTKRVVVQVEHQADEYRGTLGKLAQLIETDIPAAVAALDRMIAALQQYTAVSFAPAATARFPATAAPVPPSDHRPTESREP